MSLRIDISPDKEAVLVSQARAAGMLPESYLSQIVERALDRQRIRAVEQLGQHLDAMASQVAPGTTTEQMEAAIEEALAAVRPRRNWQS